MGISHGIQMGFDLDRLIPVIPNLQALTAPFEKQELDDVVKLMPIEKAPGPDGFNGQFLKKCWPIVGPDFLCLALSCWQG